MTKTFETKKRIIDLLKSGDKTPTEISKTLGVVPSTASQHLKELRDMGVLEEVENPHFRNTKTFKLSSNYNQNITQATTNKIPTTNRIDLRIALGAVLVLAVLGVLLYSIYNTPSGSILSPGTITLPILLTDPPQVPNGTTALTIYYSGVQLHNYGKPNTTGFLKVNASGSVNLMALVNASQVLALARVNSTAKFDAVTLDVSSATITIGGTTYNVTVPNDKIFIRFNESLNASSRGGALIDFTPTIIQVYGNDSSTFVLVPSAVAVALAKGEINTGLHIGQINGLSQVQKQHIVQARSKLEITGASISQVNNTADISITVKNNGNSTVDLKQVAISGYMRLVANFSNYGNFTHPQPQMPIIRANVGDGNSWTYVMTNSEANVILWNGSAFSSNGTMRDHMIGNGGGHLYVYTNGNASSWNGNIETAIKVDTHMINTSYPPFGVYVSQVTNFENNLHNMLSFTVDSNGTLALPFSTMMAENSQGYSLAPGQSITLTFSGRAGFGGFPPITAVPMNSNLTQIPRGFQIPLMTVDFIPNQTYTVMVTGISCGFATTNVIAT